MTAATRKRPKAEAQPATLRIAIYTRQSVADDKDFGSLQAQREAVESYVRSQPGWKVISTPYDDAGFSGGNTDRPAFRRLLEDIEHGGIDVVAVYKLDRLSRSINDFVRITDLFERHGVRFVSTTQAFDTSTSVGRMTVNLLATFATFERELISERTADRIGAARRRGLWTGGPVPLGYDLIEKRLVVNPAEADRVRETFQLYLRTGSLLAVSQELGRRGWTTKSWTMKNGETRPGRPFNKNLVSNLLRNPVYTGQVKLKGETFDGEHEAIVDRKIWDRVQRQLQANGNGCRPRARGKSGALLCGLVRCGRCGSTMTIHTARKRNHVHRSYVCVKYQKEGAAACPASRIPVTELERFVVERIQDIGRDPRIIRATLAEARRQVIERRPELEAELKRVEGRQAELDVERRNLLDAVARNGQSPTGVFEKLGEVEAELDGVTRRVDEVRAEFEALNGQVVDEEDLRRALTAFDGVWGELFPAERARVLQLLVERVTYDSREGEAELALRAGGVRELAAENETGETA